jgi:hypothetical protein
VAIVWSAVGLAGCAALSGLDSIHESVCAPECDDASADAPASQDATEDTPRAESAASPDTVSGPGADGRAPIDTGCGPLNVTSNCSACGQECASTSTTVTSVECLGQADGTGATCSYTCATGWLDCDLSIDPPNLDGCECYAPNATIDDCCTGGCPIQHDNGLNQSSSLFYDCTDAPLSIALDACAAFTGDPTQCHAGGCFDQDGGATDDEIVCSDGSPTTCVCWEYSGPASLHLYNSGSTGCTCPDATDPTYD